MRVILLIFFLVLTSCTSLDKNTYMCGERECVDKKEANEYFEKYLYLEVKISDKKKEKSPDLLKLNTDSTKKNKKIKFKTVNNKNLLELKKKEEIKKQKKLAKIQVMEERKRLKQEKKAYKLKKNKEKKLSQKKIISKKHLKKEKKIKESAKKTKKENKFCLIPENCDIDEISKFLIKIGKEKDYPNIAKY